MKYIISLPLLFLLLSNAANAQTIEWEAPANLDYGLPWHSVAIVSDNKAVAVGENGTVGLWNGIDWQLTNVGAPVILNDVAVTLVPGLLESPIPDSLRLFAVGGEFGVANSVWKTTDGGESWANVFSSGSPIFSTISMTFSDGPGIVAGQSGALVETIDGGENWSSVTSPTSNWLLGSSVFLDTASQPHSVSYFLTGTSGTAVHDIKFSESYQEIELGNTHWELEEWVGEDAITGSVIWDPVSNSTVGTLTAVGNAGTLRTTKDGGQTWKDWEIPASVDLTVITPDPIANTPTGFIGGAAGTIMSVDILNDTLITYDFPTENTILGLAISPSGKTLIAVGENGTIVVGKRTISTTATEEEHATSRFELSNFPNPFSTSTSFAFSLLETEHLSLKVYDLLGRQVATVVNRVYTAGSHKIDWHAEGLPGGVYVYQLEAGQTNRTRKLILIR